MNRNDELLDEVTELGAVSTETKGPPGNGLDTSGQNRGNGLTDD